MERAAQGLGRRQNYEAAMTFDEIADALGLKKSTVQMTYVSAIRKLTRGDRRMVLHGASELIACREQVSAATRLRFVVRDKGVLFNMSVSEMEGGDAM